MIWFFNFLLFAYLIVSNVAIFIRLYRSFLQYLSPVKGYASMILLLGALGGIDYYVFDFSHNKFQIFEENQEVYKQIKERSIDYKELTSQK
ncbi:hypothetical protein KMW28_08560 [Flammeovirga yaeyamensis]|uniref:Uncharacterized protein n=2 Tax=Flammeovirga yaeyamensis TaxID=367791 RepID=A0AAX1N828_9BACT|nr:MULTISPECIES: hypothetical protein [Flammeovirga]MBB3698987.1 hypothetical protein [Flammeovirga yaeyamensis]NMF36421.1 hypothetical protein [Flammeovirga yaeyamensis]QJD09413.1 hypothetical protein MY04_06300 [Flammeovirga sp. MY04]QWG03619.1 hypothetical protein KMW28_08560 [Flammeovirga yaeyamensis]